VAKITIRTHNNLRLPDWNENSKLFSWEFQEFREGAVGGFYHPVRGARQTVLREWGDPDGTDGIDGRGQR
jgi:hypothetical protein